MGTWTLTQRVLGRGSFATVVRATRGGGPPAAAKVFRTRDGADHEVRVLRQLASHPNIARLIDHLRTARHSYLITELQGDTLEAAGPAAARRAAAPLLRGLRWVHHKGYVHRDVKPDNVVLTGDARVCQLIDFGLACEIGAVRFFSGRHRHVAPECKGLYRVWPSQDVYGFGRTVGGRMERACTRRRAEDRPAVSDLLNFSGRGA